MGPGAVDGEVFLDWVRDRLAPALSPGNVVVHKVAGVEEAVKALYEAVEALYEAVGAALDALTLDALTPADCLAFIQSCGYGR